MRKKKKILFVLVMICSLVIIILMAILKGQHEEELTEGIVAFKNGDFDSAVRILSPFAHKGDALAQRTLAYIYAYGLGFPQDRVRALELLIATRGKDISSICYYFAENFDVGGDVTEDDVEAIWWYIKAAEYGNKNAQSLLIQAYREGLYGLPIDVERSNYWSGQFEKK